MGLGAASQRGSLTFKPSPWLRAPLYLKLGTLPGSLHHSEADSAAAFYHSLADNPLGFLFFFFR